MKAASLCGQQSNSAILASSSNRILLRQSGYRLPHRPMRRPLSCGSFPGGKLSPAVIESIMCEEKPNQQEKINIKYAEVRKYIPSSVPYEQTGAYILKALEYYHRHLERQRDDAR